VLVSSTDPCVNTIPYTTDRQGTGHDEKPPPLAGTRIQIRPSHRHGLPQLVHIQVFAADVTKSAESTARIVLSGENAQFERREKYLNS